jgi:beta-galactosidase
MRRRDFLKTAAAGPLLASPAAPEAAAPREQSFDSGWRFHRGDAAGAERPEFDDSPWRTLDVPHDWSIEDLPPHPASTGEAAVWADANCPARVGPFDRDLSEGKRDTGWVVGGAGWYRKHFSGAPFRGRHVEIRFDGVYMLSDAWLNGTHLGTHPYGYTSFAYDLTPHLRPDAGNTLAVRVRNQGRNSRWYSGSGIYRHVWLTVTGDVRVPLWGVCVTTPEVSADRAVVKVAVSVENRAGSPRRTTVRVTLRDAHGTVVGSHEGAAELPSSGESTTEHLLTVTRPKLWSPAEPRLYRAEVEVQAPGAPPDRVAADFGIRRIELDAGRGLRLNGQPVKLKGGCLHHDNGVLGAAAIDRAEERRVELMKAHGFNAIRCSHNPPSPAFLDACDRLGMLVIDEAFDCWETGKNPQDYHLYFKDWWKRDIDSMVLRDRNHPSVIFWSIGNEIPERAEPGGVASARMLVDEVKRLDPTRPVTAAIPFFWEPGKKRAWAEADPAFQPLDAGGYNYQWREYEPDHARLPRRIMVGTESFPMQAFDNWDLVEKHPYVLGDFVWTGMDYLGESGIGNAQLSAPKMPWETAANPPAGGDEFGAGLAQIFAPYPWFNAYCGDIDLIGERKPQGYYRAVVWRTSPLEMAVQRPVPEGRKELVSLWGWSDELRSWTWPGYEGRPLTVRVYSRAEQVRLLLNAREIGVKPVSAATKLRAEFEVPYAPGELRAVALAQGRPVAELAFQTVGPPAKLRLRADRTALRRGRGDLAFVTVEVLDVAGNLVPDATAPVTFTVSGAGELAGTGSANPKDPASFRKPLVRTYHGRCLAVVRPKGTPGTAELRAQSEGLAGASITIQIA